VYYSDPIAINRSDRLLKTVPLPASTSISTHRHPVLTGAVVRRSRLPSLAASHFCSKFMRPLDKAVIGLRRRKSARRGNLPE
jgi:hypothetical protein